jgi:hypothetical protein
MMNVAFSPTIKIDPFLELKFCNHSVFFDLGVYLKISNKTVFNFLLELAYIQLLCQE